MRVLCRHGHFAFFPKNRDEVLHFKKFFGRDLYQEEDYFTFLTLKGLPRWSQIGRPLALAAPLPAIITYEGRHPWDVMLKNAFVYSLVTGLVVPIAAVVDVVNLPQTTFSTVAPIPLMQPGAAIVGGTIPANVLLGYEGELDLFKRRLYVYSLETLL